MFSLPIVIASPKGLFAIALMHLQIAKLDRAKDYP
jgi:hypothetical protein